ncbi:MAG TPA: hydantoinase/oxoprolinase family protein [Syntrophomonadaceae bacterium]|nr:hydantoinase/oxoprolinase family protein [Syntrophomonadaceae bacterium]
MLIGLDVGGTYTDAVLIDHGEVIEKIKIPTKPEGLLESLLSALDPLLQAAGGREIQRIVLSTTLITNLIATNTVDPVALVLIPGPGLNPGSYKFKATQSYILSGAIDYRGREIEPLKENEIKACLEAIKKEGIKRVAIVGKFSQRNNSHEQAVASYFASHAPELQIIMGHQVTGRLNFPRRAVTTLLTLATREKFENFYKQVLQVLKERGITAPLYILKADGGTLPFTQSLTKPVETIFSGPAASTLGVLALTPKGQTSVVLDIGGTTTDLALILSGKPLLASRGAKINNDYTQVRAFATKSVALGGDSILCVKNNSLEILPQREGPAYCLGGPQPTPTDAMRVAALTEIGDERRAYECMKRLGADLNLSPKETADLVLKQMVKKIAQEIDDMFLSWEQEPAYRIWEILQKQKIRPQNVVGIGGAAPAVLPLLGEEMGCRALAPPHAEVANAIGAALAKVNLRLSFHFDTERNFYFIEENGVQEKLPIPILSEDQAKDFCFTRLRQEGQKLGISSDEELELVYSEVFNMVRGWRTTGKLYDICVQFPTGIMENWLEERKDQCAE